MAGILADVIEACDLSTGTVLQVTARGAAEPLPFEADRARRWGARYLGPDERDWGRFAEAVFRDPTTRFIRLAPAALVARDLSYSPARPNPH